MATIIRAEGEARAAELITQATARAGPGFVEVPTSLAMISLSIRASNRFKLRRLEGAKDIAEKLSQNGKITYVRFDWCLSISEV